MDEKLDVAFFLTGDRRRTDAPRAKSPCSEKSAGSIRLNPRVQSFVADDAALTDFGFADFELGLDQRDDVAARHEKTQCRRQEPGAAR